MTDRNRGSMDDLLLAYEDLDGEERRLADAALGETPGLAGRLAEIRRREKLAADPVPGPCDPFALEQDAPAVFAAELAASLARVRSAAGVTRREFSWRRAAFSLAAVLALVALLPTVPGNLALLGPPSLHSTGGLDGGHRSVSLIGRDGVLHSGQPLSLEIPVFRSARIVVFHVGPAGRTEVVHDSGPDPVDPGGAPVVLPDPAGGEQWILGGETGRETFVVAAAGHPDEGLDGIVRDLIAAADGAGDHEGAVAALVDGLGERRIGARMVSIRHLP